MKRHAMVGALSAALLLSGTAAHGWSEETHQTVGEMAYDDLAARNPQELAQLMQLVRQHPHYARLLTRTAGLNGAPRDRAIFGWLSRWPDDIRGTAADRPKWHYELRVVHGRTWAWPFRNGTAQGGFDGNMALLADRTAAPAHRAVAIGWLLHIIGDIQQPLHAGHQMTADFPLTDEAGSLAFVRRPTGGDALPLHQYWDKMLEAVPRTPASAQPWRVRLTQQYGRPALRELQPIRAASASFSLWLDESLLIAQRIAYTGSFLRAVPEGQPAPTIPIRDDLRARAVTQRRVALGGYRSADALALAMQGRLP